MVDNAEKLAKLVERKQIRIRKLESMSSKEIDEVFSERFPEYEELVNGA